MAVIDKLDQKWTRKTFIDRLYPGLKLQNQPRKCQPAIAAVCVRSRLTILALSSFG